MNTLKGMMKNRRDDMRYVTGVHALNLPCSLLTGGDWHTSALRWVNIIFGETDESVFGDYGIEYGVRIPKHEGTFAVANHIRALLDLLVLGNFAAAQGMNNDFICNSDYDEEVFEKVALLRGMSHWKKIDGFMGKEYLCKWLDYKEAHGL